ncbi:hypothetical protein K4H28_14060 [Deefgea tanakiae]|uniref:DUF6602 domain-containing protein n=1 Tax=Deefgea tanakiae TaxID=2865840 RepID=A0ABX8Z486_9NEIS|nr:DUF6602 domain-containing protein [Deefgea tanakiae]QZA77392.1 hypothetical protein K4H28_14060 [Deefgea tanakiae]
MKAHFSRIRETLVSMYSASKGATHSVVTGTLREGFVRGALQSHLPSNTAWSTGQIVGYAPHNPQSGQLDIVLHSGALPQFDFFNSFVRVIPSNASIATVEVKSDLTTGKDSTETLTKALESLVLAKNIPRHQQSKSTPIPFYILAFHSNALPATIIKHVDRFLSNRYLQPAIYWPDGILVLSGGKKYPNGFGVFRATCPVRFPADSTSIITSDVPLSNIIVGMSHAGVHLFQTGSDNGLEVLVSSLANEALDFSPANFRIEHYLYI